MKRQEFFTQLSIRLKKRGVSQEDIESQIAQFERYFSTMTDDEVNAQISTLDDLDTLADNICGIMESKKAGKKQESENTSGSDEKVTVKEEREPDAKPEVKKPEAPVEIEVSGKKESGDGELIVEEIADDEKYEFSAADETQTVQLRTPMKTTEKNAVGKDMIRFEKVDTLDEIFTENPGKKKENTGLFNRTKTHGYEEEKRGPETTLLNGNKTLFWVLVVVTLPITLSLAAAVLALFALAFLGICAIILGAILGVVAIAACGTGLALFGLIYGITQALTVLPVGLYEIGLAVTVGGISMMLGILIYNFAVRLMPILIHYLYVFFRFVVNKAVYLFMLIKKECIG